MGKIILDDFNSQKKSITWIMLIAILGGLIGFAFGSTYYCIAILLTSGACIIYFGCFFNYQLDTARPNKEKISDKHERIDMISREKMRVRTKYVEILLVAAILYVFVSVAFIADAYDHGLFMDPDYQLSGSIEQIAVYPLVFILLTAVFSPILLYKKTGKAIFVILAGLSILFCYAVFLLDFFTSFTDNKHIMIVLPFPILGVLMISYFISMSNAIKRK